jgi:hypothetical protein
MRSYCNAWLTAAVVLALAGPGRAAEADPDLAFAEKTLREAKVATDGPALLAFFRQRTLSEADRAKLAETVRRLGDVKYHVRLKAEKQLRAAGRGALSLLRPALKDPDLEIVWRADRLVKQLESDTEVGLLTAAAQVLADRKPKGAAQVLLAFLPEAGEEDYLQETLLASLAAVGVQKGKADPAVLAALADKEASRRAAAAFVVARAGAEHRPAVRRLLKDEDARVRFQAATGLAQAGDKRAVPPLIGLLGEGPMPLAWQAEDILCRLAGEKTPAALGTADAAERRKCSQAWDAWWKEHAAKADMARLRGEPALRGLTLIAEVDGSGRNGQGRISECGQSGKDRWEIAEGNGGPVDVQALPGRRVLIGEFYQNRVVERDQKGKVLWERKCGTSVVAAQRLPNGNTFIATTNELFEITPAGKTVYSFKKPIALYYAAKQRNGHILYVTSSNQVVEQDAAGKQVWSVTLAGAAWGSAEKLPSGRYLVALYSGRKVVEVDAKGKVVWEVQTDSPTYATRLRNGHTLVGGARHAVEFDRNGKKVWEKTTQGRVWRVRRY